MDPFFKQFINIYNLLFFPESELELDMDLPPKQTLGKGKRARIPNKRYSDILLSPQARSRSAENGSDRMESENDSFLEVSLKEAHPTEVASPSPAIKKQKMSVDLSDPRFLKPFKFGWKRELVWRATGDIGNKRNGDIYYYTPTGKKVRSMREVAENLKNKELSLDNFTFFKDSLGINDPEKEIIRDAKIKSGGTPLSTPKKSLIANSVKSPKSPKLPASPKVVVAKMQATKVTLSPKVSSPRIEANESADNSSPNLKAKPVKNVSNFKVS